jgi:hypothetical protein
MNDRRPPRRGVPPVVNHSLLTASKRPRRKTGPLLYPMMAAWFEPCRQAGRIARLDGQRPPAGRAPGWREVNPDPAYRLKNRPQGRFFLQGVCQPWQEKPVIGGARKTACRDTWPSAAQPIPSLPPLCSLPTGYAPRAASPLSLAAHYANIRESGDINNQHTLTDSTVYCDIT